MNTRIRSTWISLCLVVLYVLSPLVHSDVLMTNGQYHETVEDLRVKVLGGFVRADRTWYQGAWHFNRRWAPLELHYDTEGGSLARIERSDAIYEKADDAGTIYAYATRRNILVTDTGYRWQDREGNWIEYDQQGRMTAYGDRNNVRVSAAYDASGNLTSVLDHFGTQVLWYEYDPEGRVTAVRDETNRRIEYQYTNGMLTTVIDVLGNPWRYQYDAQGRLSKKIDALGRETTITYNISGMVSGAFDQEGVGTTYEYADDGVKDLFYAQTRTSGGRIDEYWYDREGHQVRHDLNGLTISTMTLDGSQQIQTDRFGNKTIITYDDWDNPIKTVYPDGTSVASTYDQAFSRITRSINENGVVTQNSYDARGNLVQVTEAVGTAVQRVTEYEYDQHGQQVLARQLGDSLTAEAVTRELYDGRGNVASHTDPEDHTTTYTYDVQGNTLTRTVSPEKVWTYEYDATGRLLRESSPLPGQTTRYEYDLVGNQIQHVNAAGAVTTYQYDLRDQLIRITDAYGGSRIYNYSPDGYRIQELDEEGKQALYDFDHEGRLIKSTDGDGNITSIKYVEEKGSQLLVNVYYPKFTHESRFDTRGRLIEEVTVLSDSTRFVRLYTYDPIGNQISVVDERGRRSIFRYDELDRVIGVTEHDGNVVEMEYDNRDNVLSRTDENGNVWSFEYDRNSRRSKEIWPLGETVRFQFDNAGNLVERIDAEDQRTTYDYDGAGRMVRSLYFGASEPSVPAKTVQFAFDVLNNLTGYDDGTTSATYEYDALQRRIGETVNYGSFILQSSREYYGNGTLKAYTGVDGVRYTYTYDGNNQLIEMAIPEFGGIGFLDYDVTSPTKVLWPGGASAEFVYDDLLRVERISNRSPSGDILTEFDYRYEGLNLISERTVDGALQEYTYDLNGRLVRVTADNSGEAYVYDAAGNRVSDHIVGGQWVYNENNQLLTRNGTVYQYDKNGNMQQRTFNGETTYFTYDIENHLVAVKNSTEQQIAAYYFDPFGRRLVKNALGVVTYFGYMDDQLIGEFDERGTQLRSFGLVPETQGEQGPLWLREKDQFYLYHRDHLGTPKRLATLDGGVVWEASTDFFGRVFAAVEIVKNSFVFPGQYRDEESGLIQNRYRDYDALVGRYIQADPEGLDAALNTYLYALGNPLSFYDITGRVAQSCSPTAKEACCRKLRRKELGTVVCLDNKRVICLDDGVLKTVFANNVIVRKCATEHEMRHRAHVSCANAPPGCQRPSAAPGGGNKGRDECEGHVTEYQCLLRSRWWCQGDAGCLKRVKDRINEILTNYEWNRNNSGWPPCSALPKKWP